VRVTLSQWIAFNEQLAGLAQVGVPLEAGLRDLALESRGSLRQLSLDVGRRLERGESLDAVLANEVAEFPPAYRGVVAAGLRSGDLGGALAALSASAKRVNELRRTFAVASIYPLIIAVLAILLALAALVPMIWSMRSVFQQFHIADQGQPARWFAIADFWALNWWIGFVVLGLLIVWWYVSGGMRAVALGGPLALVPGVSRLMRGCDQLAAAEMLGALVARDVPLHESLRLTAASVVRPDLRASLMAWGDTVERGGQVTGNDPLAVALQEGTDRSTMELGLAQVAMVLRETVRAGVWRMTVVMPALLGVGIGGVIVLVYTVGLIWPLAILLEGLFRDGGQSPM
jgi:general secretion pathway protein F